jgi:peptide-methionine (S)-S-oxide reductase
MKKLLLSLTCVISLLATAPYTFAATTETAYFGMGCFWCAQHDFDEVKGVVKTTVGYIGGTRPNPTYGLVSSGTTKYVEGIKVEFNPKVIDYQKILTFFWHNVDPTRSNGQFCDSGRQYAPRIFYVDKKQEALAEASKKAVAEQLKLPIRVQISPATKFYPAEMYHQDYYKKNPIRYKFYRFQCGRDSRLKEIWG